MWYLIGHQSPPEQSLNYLMSQWQKESFRFLDQSVMSLETGNRGSTKICRTVLVQDHSDHGARITDVECFTRSLYARWARHLLTPPFASYQHLTMNFVAKYYGHLRQGPRLFLSHCDFLQLGTELPFWRNALIASGTMHLIPNRTRRR